MGTLNITYNGETKSFTQVGSPVVAYNGNVLLSAGSWSGTKTLKCAGKLMDTNVTVGARTLECAGKMAVTDIELDYVASTDVLYRTITSSGTFTVPEGVYNRAQFFAVGGGGGGRHNESQSRCQGGGGGGGYTETSSAITTSSGTKYTVTIGAGGAYNAAGGMTSVKDTAGTALVSAQGGKCSSGYASIVYSSWVSYYGGDGGSGGGAGLYRQDNTGQSCMTSSVVQGGSDGGNGSGNTSTGYKNESEYSAWASGGKGQGTSTTFNGVKYAGGGGGAWRCRYNSKYYTSRALGGDGGGGKGAYCFLPDYWSSGASATAGTANTGGGGGGGAFTDRGVSTYLKSAASGGSGVVIVKLWEE
jgi:hypothetical protein